MSSTPPSALPDFLADLQRQVQGELRTDQVSRLLYSTDASIYQAMPYGVLIPESVDDVQAAVELAARYRIPLLPRAGGSSLAGQAVNEALVIDMTRHLDRVLDFDPAARRVRVQPGLVLDELNLFLKPHGLQFGPDPASSNRAAIGGIVSNNSTGAHSILYGMTADHVLACKGFLSDGSPVDFQALEASQLPHYQQRSGREGMLYREIAALAAAHAEAIRAGTPRHWRRCGGYNLDRFIPDGVSFLYPRDPRFNLAKLVCGAEGTLAVMSEIELNLVPLPARTALALVQFDTLREALAAVPLMLEVQPSAIELLDHFGLSLCKSVPAYARLLRTFASGDPHCILITEFYGENEAELRGHIERLRERLARAQIKCTITPAIDPGLQQNVWTVRKVGLGLLMSMKGDYKPIPFIEDAAVQPEHLGEYIARIEQFCNDLGTQVSYYAHASAGCLHVRPLINTKLASDLEKLPQIAAFSAELVGEYGGALSSEHGDGRCRSWLNERFYGKELFALYRRVKTLFDPENLFNPGNIVEPRPMTEQLRYGPSYQTQPVETHLDFREDQGFHRAVEMCNGAGVCRKRTGGTMCPSFMATRDEAHSTRGRTNALRAALSGQLPPEAFTGSRLYEIMDLCIECKACKAECPSSVDMARIKFEFLAQYYRKHRVPLRTRMFAAMPAMSRFLSRPLLAGMANLGANNPLSRYLLNALGVSKARALPHFAAQPFNRWYRKHRRPGGIDPQKKQVVLFHDTFNTYNDPHISRAALEVLEAAGYEVLLPGHRCCGRPMISKGLVGPARKAARETVEKLYPFAAAGLPIIGLEPSCLLSLRDEYRYLLPDDPRVEAVAGQSLLFEEFIARQAEAGHLKLPWKGEPGRVLLHGHCHQKALVGTGPSHQTLSLPGFQVEEVDSGCCGMAGAFGYEAEHLDISLTMGERRLLPAVRAAEEDTIIAAAGTSCRQQIAHGTGRQALHPAEVLRNALRVSEGEA